MSHFEPSPGRFCWLLGTGEHLGDADPTPEEFESACDFLSWQWQALPAALPRLAAWGGSYRRSHPRFAELTALALAVEALARIQIKQCRRVTAALRRDGIRCVLLKGSALRLLVYERPESRGGRDLDLGVTRDNLRAADLTLSELGYWPASVSGRGRNFRHARSERLRAEESKHYELAFRVRRHKARNLSEAEDAAIRANLYRLRLWHVREDGGLGCHVIFDVHHGLNHEITVADVMGSAQTVRADGWIATVPQPEWLALHLIFKLYWEGVHHYRKGGYQFADLARLAPALSGDIAMELLELLGQHNLEAAGYYVLRRLKSECGCELSPELDVFLELAQSAPDDGKPQEVNDLGDMWQKLWGLR